jgi:hypothetical protein
LSDAAVQYYLIHQYLGAACWAYRKGIAAVGHRRFSAPVGIGKNSGQYAGADYGAGGIDVAVLGSAENGIAEGFVFGGQRGRDGEQGNDYLQAKFEAFHDTWV